MMEQVPNGNERIGRLEVAVTDLSARVGRIEGMLAGLSTRVDRLEAIVTDLLSRVVRLEVLAERILTDIAELKADMKDLRKQVDANFRILAGMIIALGLGMGAVMAKGFGWI
jgi:septal ring factor EnvC (AmiA/AmiB activator)